MDHTEDLSFSEPVPAVEFCAGYAGIHLGLARAIRGLRLIAISEIEAFAAANLVAKMEAGLLDSAPVWPDLKTFPNRAFHGKVGVLVAGFPCQPFSAAGKGGADSDPRHLFPSIKQSLIDMQPSQVFLENVEGLISSRLKGDGWSDPAGTPVLLHVLRELERVGYRATAGVFSAEEVGAPHRRKRVFILAHREGCMLWQQAEWKRWKGFGGGEKVGEMADHQCEREQELSRQVTNESKQRSSRNACSNVWPSRPGEQQYDWEPPRVVGAGGPNAQEPGRVVNGNGNDELSEQRSSGQLPNNTAERMGASEERKIEPEMGRDSDGLTDRLDYAELYEACDNRTDELRLLGNGVVPATAELAYRVLSERLNRGL